MDNEAEGAEEALERVVVEEDIGGGRRFGVGWWWVYDEAPVLSGYLSFPNRQVWETKGVPKWS